MIAENWNLLEMSKQEFLLEIIQWVVMRITKAKVNI